MRITFSLEGDPSIFEGRPSEALPVAGEHGGNGDADEHFGASNLGARREYWASDSTIGSSMQRNTTNLPLVRLGFRAPSKESGHILAGGGERV